MRRGTTGATNVSANSDPTSLSRRRFLLGSGVAAGALATVACSRKGDGAAAGQTTTTSEGPASSGDLQVATLAAGLEVLAVTMYKQVIDAAAGGKLGPVPRFGTTFLQTVIGHHYEYLSAWNKVLKDGGRRAIAVPNSTLKPVLDAGLAKARTFVDIAKLALLFEEIAAATYLSAVTRLQGKAARRRAASIQAVNAKHAAILHYVLGDYPVPDTFAREEKALKA